MPITVGGDTLALDVEIRRQIDAEFKKITDRFPDERIDAKAIVHEELDPLHGHRVRCELSLKLRSGRGMVVREARKSAAEAITETFGAARRRLRHLRRQELPPLAPQSRELPRIVQFSSR